MAGLLSARGVDLNGWDLQTAGSVSANGNRVAGTALVGGHTYGYLADLSTGGVTTPGALASSLDSAAAATSSQTLGTMTTWLGEALTAAGQGFGSLSGETGLAAGDVLSRWSAYAVGSLGLRQDNRSGSYGLNGTTGLTFDLAPGLAVGAGVIGSHGRNDLDMGGHATLDAAGGSAIASYTDPSGLRLAGAGFVARLDQDTHRGYMNGAGTSSSHGETQGWGYGAAGQAGWQFDLPYRSSVTPYAELDWSKASLGDYTESGGPFPARFGDMDGHRTVGRLGASLAHGLTPALTVSAGGAWGHRLGGQGAGLEATAEGLTVTRGADAGDRDWAEGSVGALWRITGRTSLSAALSAHTGRTPEPQETGTVGVRVRF